VDIGRAFAYPFEDSDWLKKVVIGGILNLIPIVNFATVGYAIQEMERVSRGEWVPLPEWDNFGDKFMNGLIIGIALIVWLVPVWILLGASIVPIVLSSMAHRSSSAGLGASLLAMFLGGIWSFVVAILYPAIAMNYARKRTFGSCFEFSSIVGMVMADPGSYVLGIVAYLGAAILVGLIAQIPFIGWIIGLLGGFYVLLVLAGAYGQVLASISPGAVASSAPVAPPAAPAHQRPEPEGELLAKPEEKPAAQETEQDESPS